MKICISLQGMTSFIFFWFSFTGGFHKLRLIVLPCLVRSFRIMKPLLHLARSCLPTYKKIFMYTVRKPNLSGLNLESGKIISISAAIGGSFRFLQPLPHLHVRIVLERSYIWLRITKIKCGIPLEHS